MISFVVMHAHVRAHNILVSNLSKNKIFNYKRSCLHIIIMNASIQKIGEWI
jgi:hypothetical protein